MADKNEKSDKEKKNETRQKRSKASRKRNRSIAGRDGGVNQSKNRIKWVAKRVILSDPELKVAFTKETTTLEGGKSAISLKLRLQGGEGDKELVADGVNYYLNHVHGRLMSGISTKMAMMAKGQRREDGQRKRKCSRVTAQHVLSVACSFLPAVLAVDTKTIFEEARKEVEARRVSSGGKIGVEDAEGDSRPKYRKFSLSTAPVTHAFRLACQAYTMGEFVPLAIIAVDEAVLRRMMLLGLRFLTGQWEIEAFSKSGKLHGQGDVTLGINHLYMAANYDRPPYTESRGLAAILASNEYGVRYVPVELCTAIGASRYRPELSWKEDVAAYRRSVKKARVEEGAAAAAVEAH